MAQISESDIGKRVTVRLHDSGGYRDIVGHLVTTTSLRNRHGELVQFNPAEIYIWREIVEIPRTATSGAPLSIRIYELERLAASTWQPLETEYVGGWLLRADVGITKRANSALVLNTEDHIEETIAWYKQREMVPIVSLVPELHAQLDRKFSDRGFRHLLDLNVMVKDGIESEINFEVANSDYPDSDWLAVHGDEGLLPLLTRTPARYLTIREKDRTIAIGRLAFAQDWAILSRIWVDPKLRGKGFGRKMLNALESQAGDKKIALQVSVENKVAINLYESAGYETHHTCRFRELLQQRDPSQSQLR